MGSHLNPYIHFADNAREAMEFYQSVLGGDLSVMTFSEGGMPHDPAEAHKVMHAQLITDTGFWLMGSDTPSGMRRASGTAMTVSLSGDDDAELRGYWERLRVGAAISMELAKAPWGDSFGALTDRFGIPWLVNIAGKH